VNYLTSWDIDINVADEEGGLTPLHLAVISGNSRVVRKLLIKGADKSQ
jgi:palmitoyltransferase